MALTWSELKTRARNRLPNDSTRDGIQTYLDEVLRDAAADLQTFIPRFQKGHETLMPVEDFFVEGVASVGSLPEFNHIKEVYIVDTVNADDPKPCNRKILGRIPWSYRLKLSCGTMCPEPGTDRGFYAIDPQDGRTIMVAPILDANNALLVYWDGKKLDFNDTETTPFPENAAEAMASYAKYHILSQIEEAPTSQVEREEQMYKNRRALLAVDNKE